MTESNACKRMTNSNQTPTIIVDMDGYIKILGSLTTDHPKLVFSNLFWRINKIVHNQVVATIHLDTINAEGEKYIRQLMRILANHKGFKDVTILWVAPSKGDQIHSLGMALKKEFPEVSFQLFSI